MHHPCDRMSQVSMHLGHAGMQAGVELLQHQALSMALAHVPHPTKALLILLADLPAASLAAACCRIVYATGEFEDVDMEEMVRDGHMALLPL